MADLTYKFSGVNTRQLEREVEHLRQNSSTFRALEAAAAAAGYSTIEIQMGANLVPRGIARMDRVDATTRKIVINSDASASWGTRGRQATVGEVLAHELAHAVVPPEYRTPGVIDPLERDAEGMWVRRQAGQVALDLGLPGPNNADVPATRIPINEVQGCTVERPQGDGARDGVLFLDGTRGYNGIGAPRSFEPPSQDPISSRRLAGEEQEGLQEEADGGKASPSIIFNGQPEDAPLRYLSRRFVGRSGVPTNVNPRPDVLNQAVPRSAGSQGLINGQPMPNYAVPPPIFGLPDQSAVAKDDANEWFDRWIRPFVRQ